MARKRSRYRPKPVISDPLSLLRPASAAQREKLHGRFLSALESMSRGSEPTVDDWRDLSDAINTVETLALHTCKLVPSEVMPIVNAAVTAMGACGKRHRAGGHLRLDGPGLEAVRDVVDIYRQCMDGLTEREMALAQAETQRRMYQLLQSREPDPQLIAI